METKETYDHYETLASLREATSLVMEKRIPVDQREPSYSITPSLKLN